MLGPETRSTRKPTFDKKWLTLVNAAATVFSDQGYDKASMRHIGRVAGLSLSGIYHYVTGKEELLYWIQFHTFDSLLRGLESSLEGVEEPRARVRTAVHNHVQHFGENICALKVCARELDKLAGDAYQEVYDRRRSYFEAVHALIKALPPKPEAPVDTWLATANLFGMLNWFYQWYDPQSSHVSLDELATQQTALFLDGYAGPTNKTDRETNHT